jgi:hypothetical protein
VLVRSGWKWLTGKENVVGWVGRTFAEVNGTHVK